MKASEIISGLSQSTLDRNPPMLSKFCPRCQIDKLITEFSRNRTKKDGFADWCKPCTRGAQKTPDQIEKSRNRAMRWRSVIGNPERLKAWRQLPESKRRARFRAWLERQTHYGNIWARNLAYSAIRKGELQRKPCEVCQSKKVDAHHDDYTKPLDVRWLCRRHHNAEHAKQ